MSRKGQYAPRHAPPLIRRTGPSFSVACPTCGALKGALCVRHDGNEIEKPHVARVIRGAAASTNEAQ